MSHYQKGKVNLDFTEQETVSGSGISWASFQTVTIKILQAGCHSCRSTSSIKALKALQASHSCFFISPLHWHCTHHKTDVSSKL